MINVYMFRVAWLSWPRLPEQFSYPEALCWVMRGGVLVGDLGYPFIIALSGLVWMVKSAL